MRSIACTVKKKGDGEEGWNGKKEKKGKEKKRREEKRKVDKRRQGREKTRRAEQD